MYCRRSCANGGRERGFTLIELLVAIMLGAALVLGAFIALGRVIVVDSNEAMKAVTKANLENLVVAKRDYVLPSSLGCAYDDAVAFIMQPATAVDVSGQPEEHLVCCKSWYRGCRMGN